MEINEIGENKVRKKMPELIEGEDYTITELSNGGYKIVYQNKAAQETFNNDFKKIIEHFTNTNPLKEEHP